MNTTHRPELTYDGIGINGPDEHRSRVAAFDKQADADKYGPLFAAAPDLLAALQGCIKVMQCADELSSDARFWIEAAHDTINKAKGVTV